MTSRKSHLDILRCNFALVAFCGTLNPGPGYKFDWQQVSLGGARVADMDEATCVHWLKSIVLPDVIKSNPCNV